MSERKEKAARVRAWLKRHKLDAAVFLHRANFAWLSGGGDNHVCSQSERGVAALVVTSRQLILCASTIEADRVVQEEHLAGWTVKTHPWTAPLPVALKKILGRKRAAADDPGATGLRPLPGDFVDEVRLELTPADIKCARALGRDCALAVETVARQLSVGASGFQVEADLARHLLARGIQPHVVLVGFDDRLRRYRHPVPTANHLRHHALLSCCGQRHGLIASLTRAVHFGPPPADVVRAHRAVLKVEAAFWRATTPGATWGEAFRAGVKQYRKEGFEREWERHHQGGPTGFAAREFYATAAEKRRIRLHTAVAWNPTITGAKSEDTFILTPEGPEVITVGGTDWPQEKVSLGGHEVPRPGILVKHRGG